MPSRYQFQILDLLPLVALWPPCLLEMYTFIMEGPYVVPMWVLVFFEILLAAVLLAGWCFGLKIANSLEYRSGWKRMGILLLGWAYAPSLMLAGWGMLFLILGNSQKWLRPLGESIVPWVLIFISLHFIVITIKLNRCADAAWKTKQLAKE